MTVTVDRLSQGSFRHRANSHGWGELPASVWGDGVSANVGRTGGGGTIQTGAWATTYNPQHVVGQITGQPPKKVVIDKKKRDFSTWELRH